MKRTGGVGKRKRNAIREKDLDQMFSRIIRSAGKCRLCGTRDRLQCAHLIPRSYRAVRWSEDNAWCLCLGCHKKYTHRPIEWDQLLSKELGLRYEDLRMRALEYAKPDYPTIAARLRARLEVL